MAGSGIWTNIQSKYHLLNLKPQKSVLWSHHKSMAILTSKITDIITEKKPRHNSFVCPFISSEPPYYFWAVLKDTHKKKWLKFPKLAATTMQQNVQALTDQGVAP